MKKEFNLSKKICKFDNLFVDDVKEFIRLLKANSKTKEISFGMHGDRWIKISEKEIDELAGDELNGKRN